MSVRSRALETIRRHGLARPGDRVLVALSGGADSVALLGVLKDLEADGVLAVAGAAHLNHQLRGADADADEAFCAALAARMGVPFIAGREDVAGYARAQKRSIEDAARAVRYAFLERAAVTLRADVIAVAHTKEDQAETFLLRLMRGAGTRGLSAIRPRAGRVIRPLLEIERAALREYLSSHAATFREDATNADVAIPRNRVRHELIPYLRSHFSPAVTDVLARAAGLAREDEEFLQAEAIKLASRVVLSDVTIRLDVPGLRSAPRALSSRVAHAALQRLAGPRSIHFDHVDRLLALAADDGVGDGCAVSLPGQSAVRLGDSIILRRANDRRQDRRRAEGGPPRRSRDGEENSFAFVLSIPGEVQLGSRAVGAERVMGPGGRGGVRHIGRGGGPRSGLRPIPWPCPWPSGAAGRVTGFGRSGHRAAGSFRISWWIGK